MAVIRQLPLAVSATHPTNAPTALAAANNSVVIAEILQIVRGSRPPEGDARRAVYDAAVATLGEGSGRDAAIAYLTRSHVASISRLHGLVAGGESMGENAGRVEMMLSPIDAGIGAGGVQYIPYEAIGNEVSTLLRVARGGQAVAVPTATDTSTTVRPLPLIETPLRDLGPIHLLSSAAEESVVALNATSTPALNSMFGGESIAQASMNALANAYATMANHSNDLAAQQAAAQALHSALSAIPSTKEIWNGTVHPHFNAAMQALARGDLRTGLSELSQEPSFNAVYGQMNNLYIITVNQRAVSVLRAGVTTRYEFTENQDAFTAFIRGSANNSFEPRVLWLGLGLHYERLLLSGQLHQLAVTPGTGGSPGTVTETRRQRVQGTGDVFTATPQLAVGFSAWSNPVELIIHCSVGYQSYSVGADVPTQGGGTQRLETNVSAAYGGPWGAQINFPGREGQRMMVRMSSVSLGMVGNPVDLNAYANVSFEGRWYEGNTLRIRSEATLGYQHFLQQHGSMLDIRPADFTFQVNPQWSLFFGPGFRYTTRYDSSGEELYHTLDGYGAFGFRFDRGVSVDIRGGYLGEVGGREEERIPSTPYGSLNITLTPQLWFGGSQRPAGARDVGSTVPRRRRRE
ncbi:hypothetical protein L0Y65_06895 [Candidatus Micrarchaeota archaeon]|nr:hypothetical protein [Candidatus Micrarchaeota archaeon]